MAASRVVYPSNSQLQDPHIRSTSPIMASSPPTRIRTSGIFTRRLSLTAASVANSVASSSLFGSSPPPAQSSGIYQQGSFFRSSSSAINNNPVASSSSINVSSAANNVSSSPYMNHNAAASSAALTGPGAAAENSRWNRTRSTSHPPPPKYKTSRTPQLRISLQDAVGNLVLSAPVMAPGESIRGQIHLELPKATPVHSIEVCLTGTVTALDGTRLGSMKTVTILEECKTVATASITNTRTNTTRRHTTPAPAPGTVAGTAVVAAAQVGAPIRGRSRRSSVASVSAGVQDRGARSPPIPIQNTIAAAVAATLAAQGHSSSNSRSRPTAELMSRTLSMPSPYYSAGQNSSTLSLNRSVSPTPADLRGRRTSFSANVDTPIGGFGGSAGVGRSTLNMSMVNISTIAQLPLDDSGNMMVDDPSMPAAPSYDPPNYERIASETENDSARPSGESSSTDAVLPSQTDSIIAQAVVSSTSAVTAVAADDASGPAAIASPATSSENVSSHSRRSSREGAQTLSSTETTVSSTTPPPAEPAEPKAVLMQPGNYVIPFSIRIPANTVMSLPGSFSDPVGSISYQLQAVMKQILPSQDPYDPKAILVEPTFTSTSQVVKLIPMNDPTYMPLYNVPFETESVRSNVGHWVWSTGFMEAHAWVPKQGYRPGRIVPLVIHIVNHSDARQVTVETTLCKCLHYGSGLSKIRAMGIAGQGYLMDPTLAVASSAIETSEEDSQTIAQASENNGGRRRTNRRTSSGRGQQQQQQQPQDYPMPSPPASPYGTGFPSTSTSEHGDDSPEGSVHGARMASPNSMASISSQWESIHSNSSDSNNTPLTSGAISYNPESQSAMTSPTSSVANTITSSTLQQVPLPIVQHQREKMSKSKTLINCSLAVDREIQKTIPIPIPVTTGYSILNAPLLEVSYEIVIKIRAEKVYSRSIRLSVPIVVLVPEEGDVEEEEELLVNAGMASPAMMARDLGLAFSGDEYDIGDQGECPPYEATAGTSTRRRGRR